MGKCKNIDCANETCGDKVYCSLSCRNYYVNKYLRDYTKNGEGLSKEIKLKYTKNPKYCKNSYCGKEIDYTKRRNDYCNSSCQAVVTNLNRVMTQKTKDKIKETYLKNNGLFKTIPCKNCNCEILIKDRKKFCSVICKKSYNRKDMDEFQIYKLDTNFKFNLADYPNEFDFSLIEKHGWYAPSNSKKPNINGVSRDHMISVRDGFNKQINPKLLSHPANCRLMVHNDNISKNKKSILSEEELIGRIKKWDIKYE